jgi:hypothetical protein
MHKDVFLLNDNEYVRDIDPVNHYTQQVATYLAISTGKTYDECEKFVKTKLRDRTFPNIRNPDIRYFERENYADRHVVEGDLLSYIKDAVKNRELIAPTMTTYVNPAEKQSLLVTYIDSNIKARSAAKKEEFAAKAAGNEELEKIKNIEQTNRKLSNNAISGAHVSPSTPLYNRSSHSTLTSNCRSTSGYGNANNEKFLCGNRHYWNAQLVLCNIIDIITHTDLMYLELIMNKYQIHYPDTNEVMKCIKYSTDLYWANLKATKTIKNLVDKLNPIQKAAFLYIGDLYHLRKYNDSLLKGFISELSSKVTTEQPDPLAVIKSTDEDILNLAHQICIAEVKGIGKDYNKIKDTQAIHTLASTCLNIEFVIRKYSELIRAFFVTDNMPASVGYFPESIRRSVITSDTDSTIFTVQDWVKWHTGELGFDDVSMAVAASMIYLSSQTIKHLLSKMSANFGIQESRLHQIAMKNEFKFDVFVPTNVAKHYYALISCQEGNVFAKDKIEIKGVHLKSSNAPEVITTAAADLMREIMDTIKRNQKIKIMDILKRLADIERNIIHGVRTGDLQYFRLGEIKRPESYIKSAEESPYAHYILWKEVLSDYYGDYGEPPYQTLKISTTLVNPTNMSNWLANMTNKELSKKFENYFNRNNKKAMPIIMIPLDAMNIHGIPPELLDVIDTRRIVYDTCKIFYMILETLGIYITNDKITKLASDFY